MSGYSTAQIWLIILLMAVGTYVLRLSFLGLIGRRKLPLWVLRHLRYAPMAVLPALVAPLVVWPSATDGALDPPRLIAAALTIAAGMMLRNTLAAIFAGAVALYGLLWILG